MTVRVEPTPPPARRGGLRLLAALLLAAAAGSAACSSPEGHGLLPLLEPDLSGAEAQVREQLASQLAVVEELLARRGVEAERLGAAYADLGFLYITYSFLDAAEVCFDNAQRLQPNEYRWPYVLGYLHQTRGNPEQAERALERALALRPGDPASRIRLGRLRLDQGDLDAAQRLFERVLEDHPGSAAATDGLAKVAAARGEHREAVRRFERALELQPSAGSIHHGLGLAYRQLGDLERARDHLERGTDAPVLFEDPVLMVVAELGLSAELYKVRGAQAFAENRFDSAVDFYRRALEIEPHDFTSRKVLGFSLEKLGDFEGAIDQLHLALEQGTTGDEVKDVLERAEIYRILGSLMVVAGRDEEAIDYFRSSIRLHPDKVESHLRLANALARNRRFAAAVEHYDFVLGLMPDHAETLLTRGAAVMNLGRREEALQDLRRATELEPDDPRLRLRYAEALDFVGRRDEAEQQRRRAASLSLEERERSELMAAEAARRLGRGDAQGALDLYTDALAANPRNLDARFELASLFAHLGRYQEALSELEKVIEEVPQHGPARRAEAIALLLMGRYGEARARLQAGLQAMPRNRQLAHLLARLAASAPDPSVRDGRLAVELAERLHVLAPGLEVAETLAMAWAEAGHPDRAVDIQQRALAAAQAAGDDHGTRLAAERLRAYRSRLPWRAESPEEIARAGQSAG